MINTIDKADIVTSLNGRDKGKLFIVTQTREEYSLIADGKGRKIEKPKLKKSKHLKYKDKSPDRITEKILTGEKVTNNEIRRTLAEYTSKAEVING